MRRTATWLLVAAMLAVPAAACGGVAGDRATPEPIAATPAPAATASQPPVLAVPSPSAESSSNAEQQAAVDAARHDAAERLSLANGAGDVQVQQVEARRWPDASLGCPRQDEQYLQVITPGYLVVVSAAGKQLEYHADSRGRVVLCQER